MRKLILKMSMSIDGFVCGPKGEIDWIFKSMNSETEAWTLDVLWQAGVHIMGRKTYQDMAAYWPFSTQPFAAPMNEIPKILFTRKGYVHTSGSAETTTAFKDASRINNLDAVNSADAGTILKEKWSNSKIASGDLLTEINMLKQQPGKDILAHGGAGFVQSLVKLSLIDEYRLLIHPAALGAGMPLFPALPETLELKLISSSQFKTGTIANVYHPV